MSKRNRLILLGAASLALIAFVLIRIFSGAGGKEKAFFQPKEDNRVEVNEDIAAASNASNVLGSAVLSKTEDNLVVANVALANTLELYAAGNENSKEAVNELLGTKGDTKETFASLNNQLEGTKGYTSASGFWVQKSFEPAEEFIEKNGYYRTYFGTVDFSDFAAAGDHIGEYIKEQSEEKLDGGIQQLSPDTGMVLVGGQAFSGTYAALFAGTKPIETAFAAGEETQSITALEGIAEIQLYEDDAVQFATIPLDDGFDLQIYLPRNGVVPISNARWEEYAGDTVKAVTRVVLPEMNLYSKGGIDRQLKELGLQALYEETQSISGTTGNAKLHLTRIENHAKLALSPKEELPAQELVEEATLSCTRPFFFAILHRETGAKILTGQYRSPQS